MRTASACGFGRPGHTGTIWRVDLPELKWLVIEGGGNLALIWQKEAERHAVSVMQVAAETWRQRLLLPRERRNGRQAKHHSREMARRVIEWSGADRATSLRHDAAEAILIGLWGVLELGWLEGIPARLHRASTLPVDEPPFVSRYLPANFKKTSSQPGIARAMLGRGRGRRPERPGDPCLQGFRIHAQRPLADQLHMGREVLR